jgi:MFS family permease
MPLSSVDTISVALEHTKQQLFRPFRIGQWLRLALLGFMTGELSSGGGCDPRAFTDLKNIRNQPNGIEQFGALPHMDPHYAGSILLLVGVSLLLLCVVILVWMYVGSVFRFILIESIVTKRVTLREGWPKWHAAGRRFFLWRMVYQIALGIFFAILVGIPLGLAALLGWFNNPEAHRLPIALGAILLLLLIVLFVVVAAVVWLLAKDFMAPIMALENLDFAESWNKLLAIIKKDVGSYAAYIGMKIVLNIAAGIVFGIAIFLVILMIAIPFGVAGVMAVFAGKAAGLTWTVGTITLAIVAGTVFFAVLMFVSSMLSVPLTVYFPAYSIYFFASRYPKLDAWLHPAPAPAAPFIAPAAALPLDPEPIT